MSDPLDVIAYSAQQQRNPITFKNNSLDGGLYKSNVQIKYRLDFVELELEVSDAHSADPMMYYFPRMMMIADEMKFEIDEIEIHSID